MRKTRRRTVSLRLALTTVVLTVILVSPPVLAHPGWGIVTDAKGQIYFSDVDRNCVWKIGADGKTTVFVRGKHSHDLAIDAEGNLHGEHVWYDGHEFHASQWIAAPDGTVHDEATYASSIPGQASTPTAAIALSTGVHAFGFTSVVDHEGNRYYMSGDNHLRTTAKVLEVTPAGEVSTVAGGAWGWADGPGERARFRNFGVMVLGPDDALYLTEGGNLRRITRDGTVTTLAKGLTDDVRREKPPFFGLMGLAIDRRGDVIVADYGNRLVRRITQKGEVTTIARASWPWRPTGVAVRGDQILVLEAVIAPGPLARAAGSPRVRRIAPDGTFALLARAGR